MLRSGIMAWVLLTTLLGCASESSPPGDMPAGPAPHRVFRLRACDALCAGRGFSAGLCRQTSATDDEREQALAQRTLALLTAIASYDTSAVPDSEYWEMNTLIANARIRLGTNTAQANAFLEQTTDAHGTDRDGAVSGATYPHPYGEPNSASHDWDFVATHIVNAYFSLELDPNLSDAARTNLRAVIENRAGEPFSELTITYSENHDAMIAHVAHLANILAYGDDTTFNVDFLSWFIDDKAKRHYHELNSPTYMGPELSVLYNLREYSNNQLLKDKAEMLLDMLLAEQAVIGLDGIRGGPFFRYYDDQAVNQANDYFYRLSHLYFGTPNEGMQGSVWRVHTPYSSYRPPDVVYDIAAANRGSFEFTSRRPLADTYYYITPSFVLASAQGELVDAMAPPYPAWAEAHQWDLSFDTSPTKLISSETSGSVQHENVIIVVEGAFDYVGEPYEETLQEAGWTFIREGGTYAAIRLLNDGRALLEARLAADYSSFAAFRDDLKDNALTDSGGSVTYDSTLGDKIESASAYQLTVNDVAQDFAYPLFDSPFMSSDWDSGYIVVEHGAGMLTLDFRDPANPIKTEVGAGEATCQPDEQDMGGEGCSSGDTCCCL